MKNLTLGRKTGIAAKDRGVVDDAYETTCGGSNPPLVNLIHDDCIEAMKRMDEGSFDLTVTSPPYDNLRTYEGSLVWNEDVWKEVLSQLYRVTKQGGVVVWVVGDATIKGSETGTSFKQALYAMECGFNLHDTMIWQKVPVPYDPKCNRYWQGFEYMFVLSKGKPKCNYIKVPCKGAGKSKAGDYGQRHSDGSTRVDRHSNDRVIKDTKVKDNIWFSCQSRGSKDHPATFPEQLAHDHIISWSNEGDTVFDPFMGSGTTGLAAQRLNRSFIGIEKVEKYYDLAKERIGS
jgi:DNA modification methylase